MEKNHHNPLILADLKAALTGLATKDDLNALTWNKRLTERQSLTASSHPIPHHPRAWGVFLRNLGCLSIASDVHFCTGMRHAHHGLAMEWDRGSSGRRIQGPEGEPFSSQLAEPFREHPRHALMADESGIPFADHGT
jgi:hypothetical protein